MGEIESRSDTRVTRIPGGTRGERAIGALGWWLPETAAAGVLVGLALWAGWPFLVYVIVATLAARIASAWPPMRCASRAVTTAAGRVIAARRRPAAPASAPTGDEGEHRDEVAS